MRTNVLKFGS